MSESSAGSILAYLRMDIASFEAGIAKAQELADRLDSKNVDVQVKADTAGAETKLAALAVSEDRVGNSSKGASSGLDSVVVAARRLTDATGAANVAQLRLSEMQDGGKAKASQLAKASNDVERAQRALADATFGTYSSNIKLDDSNQKVDRSARMATTGLGGMSSSLGSIPGGSPVMMGAIAAGIALIGPATGAATAGAVGLGGALGVTILAYQGFKSEIASGTTLGQQMSASVGGISAALTSMEHIAAGSMGPGVLAAFGKISGAIPSLTGLVSGLGTDLGAAFSITADGLISLLHALAPLLSDAGGYARSAASAFASFAASEGFKSFVAYSQQELPKVIELTKNLTTDVVGLGVAAAPTGDSLLTLANSLATIIGPLTAVAGKVTAFQNTDAVKKMGLGPLGIFGPMIDSTKALFGATEQAAPSVAKLSTVTDTSAASATTMTNAIKTQVATITALNTAMDAAVSKELSLAGATSNVDQATLTMNTTLKANNKTMDEHTQKGIDDRRSIEGVVGSLQSQRDANIKSGMSTADATVKYEAASASLLDQTGKMYGTTSQAYKYMKQLLAIPANVKTQVDAATEAAKTKIWNLQAQIEALHGKEIAVSVAANFHVGTGASLLNTSNVANKLWAGGGGANNAVTPASGGYITGEGTGTSDSIRAMVSNGEYVVKASQTAKNLPLLHAINSGAQGFAHGGFVGLMPQLALAAGGPLPLPTCISPDSQLNQLRQVLS